MAAKKTRRPERVKSTKRPKIGSTKAGERELLEARRFVHQRIAQYRSDLALLESLALLLDPRGGRFQGAKAIVDAARAAGYRPKR